MHGARKGLAQNSLTTMTKDDSGAIWIGTYKEGINYYHPHLVQFRLLRIIPFQAGAAC